MDNWDDYRLILAVQQSNSMRDAGKLLGVNHATISRRVNTLNASHPHKVFYQTPQGLELTDYGSVLLDTAQQMQALLQGQKSVLDSGRFSKPEIISLSLPYAILQCLLLEDVIAFQSQYGIKIQVLCSYDFADLNRDEADVVVRVSNNPGNDLIGHRVGAIQVGYYATQEYLDNNPEYGRQWIVGDDHAWIKESPYPDASILTQVNDLIARHELASRGFGMIRGADYIAKQYKNLATINSELFSFQDLWVLTHKDKHHTLIIKQLMSFLLNRLRERI